MKKYMHIYVYTAIISSEYGDLLKGRLNAACCENVLASNYQTKPMVTNPAENSKVGLN